MQINSVDLRIGNSKEQKFISNPKPTISWKINSMDQNLLMEAYKIEIASDLGFKENTFETGEVARKNPINISWPKEPLSSREVAFLRVSTKCNGKWGNWSETKKVEAAIFEREDWQASFITLPDDQGRHSMSPLPLLRKEFSIDQEITKGRAYVSALGLYEISLNGQRISSNHFEPGWTDYNHELPVVSHNITDFLKVGKNVVTAILGDGWYRGQLGWEAHRNIYGVEIGLLCQLEISSKSGVTVICSDKSWKANTGEFLHADIYEGVNIDFNLVHDRWKEIEFNDSNWINAKVLDHPKVNLVPIEVPPITITSTLRDPIQSLSNDGKRIYRFDRNITGWVSVKVKGKQGSKISIKHAEILDQDGNLYTRNLRKAKATDQYILNDSEVKILEPIFTYHGFQYVEVDGDVEILDIEAKIVHSDIKEIAKFESSNILLNKLVQNIKNSQKGNFFSVPTDCPQRDERLGWSGDIQSFSRTAVNLFDCQHFLSSWLRQLSHSQLENGAVTSVVPNVLDIYQGPGAEQGGLAGWGDASTIVPWNLYQAYKDEETLSHQIPSMRKWVSYLDNKVEKSGLIEETEGQIGDWLDPDAPFGSPDKAKVNMAFVVNAFHSYSTRLLGKSLLVLGKKQEAEKYLNLATSIAKKSWTRWGDEVISTSTGCAIALEFEMLNEEDREKVASALSDIVFANSGKATYGLVGTARILPALSHNGKLPAALKALFNVECPGWLHQVNQGATTIWERWDSIQADGSIDEEPHFWKGEDVGMNSFNHYHLGSIGDWIIENIGGIALTKDHPAYEVITFAPRPNSDVNWCKTSLETPFGKAELNWKFDDGGISGDMTIPPGSRGLINFPLNEGQELTIDETTHSSGNFKLGSGQYIFTTGKRK